MLCRSHQKEIIKLLGASISSDYIYLVYEYVKGSNLSNCLRNPKSINFTILSTWMSRMQIATDVAHGLEYIHYHTGFSASIVHKHVKSSGIIVTEPDFHAKICNFGAAELCGETGEDGGGEGGLGRRMKEFDGVRGYMSPEFQETGDATQKSDVYAFGVVLLELLSGEEPLKYKFDKATNNYQKISIIETAREAVEGGGEGGVDGRLRRWVDRRLKDSFPVEVVEKLTRVALSCVHVEASDRPNMRRISGKISKLYLESKIWSDRVNVPNDISVSLAPR
ncbi:hypothetical protein Leryth_016438 [Lithospermum erythrorhizon]|nr:hypothetical protein Leryth_016438 [Lithospermum erythrorhizon]